MSSRKRSRDGDDLEEEIEIESASSSFRQTAVGRATESSAVDRSNPPPQKRSRVALAAEHGGSTVSDDDSEEDVVEDPSLYAHLLDPEEDDDEIDDLRGTQVVQKQFRAHKENLASEQGVIEEVFCRNFMCHSKLRVRLGPLINFIIGHNGSGKSAVLTALTMCLGGKATATNRGASLKSLIKQGEESATLSVKIKNQGDGAYKPELYGHSIIVERHFSQSGTSGFRLKNAGEKVISTKKSDLDDMLDFFAFQLDNPINVLTQDMARQFLSNSTPHDKYKFFIRGTQLETLDADYKVLEENLDNIEARVRSREEDMSVLRRKAEEAEKKKRQLDQTKTIREKIKQTQRMHAWAQVEEQEGLLQKAEADVQAAEDKVEQLKVEAEDSSGAYEGHNQAYEAAVRTLDGLKTQLEPVEQNYEQHKANFEANKNELLEVHSQMRKIREDHKDRKNDVTRLEGDIEQESARLAAAEGPEHAERLERLQELRDQVDETQGHLDECLAERPELDRKRDEARTRMEDARPALEQQRSQLEQEQNRLRQIDREQGQQWGGYRQNTAQLVRAVENETRWRSKPVGPVGAHVQLKEPRWSSLLEKTFGGVLESFIVTCKEDQTMLSQIMRRVNCTPNIFIGDPTPLNTTGKEPDEDVNTILRVLNITNDMVRNQLIINQSIEQTALFDDREVANRFMNGGQRPRNVRVAIALKDRRGGIRFEYSRSGAAKTSPVAAWTGQPRMKTDRQEQINMLNESIASAKRDLHTTEQDHRSFQRQFEQSKQALAQWERRRRELIARHQQAEDAVEGLTAEIENNRPQDGRLQELQRQLEEAREAVESIGSSYQDVINEKDRLGEKGRELKALMDEANDQLQQVTARILKANGQVQRTEDSRLNALAQKNRALEAIEDAQTTVEELQKRRDTQKETVEMFNGEATKICQRVPVERNTTPSELDARIERFEQDLQRREQEAGGTREQLTQAWQEAVQAYRQAQGQLVEMQKFAKDLTKSLTERQYRWKMFRKYIAARARLTFMYLLSERQFRGRVIMDHRNKMLDIKVEPDLSKASDAGRETRTLSGGEKSFSTICLLLAIWEAMGSPIRCLDEFDVFMDSVNRATSMSMMIQAARRSVGRQFILITPQAMNNVAMGDDVKVHRMSDPERGQTALPY